MSESSFNARAARREAMREVKEPAAQGAIEDSNGDDKPLQLTESQPPTHKDTSTKPSPAAAAMLPESIEEDTDLPDILDTAAKQEKRAKILASSHLGKKAHSVQSPNVQGFFSRTQIVKMVGGDKLVIQFRIKPLDMECFHKARRLFGGVVPEITQLRDEEVESLGMLVFAMSYMPGQVFVRSSGEIPHIKIAASLGAILGRGLVADQSADVVDTFVLPSLRRLQSNIGEKVNLLQPHIERLIVACPGLKKLALHFSHFDLNEMNVLIDTSNSTVSGNVDWECSRDLPFGMGLHRITDTIVANDSQGEIEIPKVSKEAEKAFWDAVLQDAPKVVLDNLEDVQNTLLKGSLLFAIEGKWLEGPDPGVRFLAGILTYRMPQLRGDADPFAAEYMSKKPEILICGRGNQPLAPSVYMIISSSTVEYTVPCLHASCAK